MNKMKNTLCLLGAMLMSFNMCACGNLKDVVSQIEDDANGVSHRRFEAERDEDEIASPAMVATMPAAEKQTEPPTEPPTESPTEPELEEFVIATKPSKEDTTENGNRDISLPSDGDRMTILAWNANDVDPMLDFWLNDTGYSNDQINLVNFDCGGGDAAANFDQYFLSGEDCDIFFVEADWALRYINDNRTTAPLSSLGFTEADFANQYAYTLEIGKDSNGVLKGVSWQAAPGAWCYRTDLAEAYLGIKTPEEMQSKVSDWDAFYATAAEVSALSGGQTALTTTLGGIWQVFSSSRTTPWVVDGKLAVDDFCYEFVGLAKSMRDNGYVTGLSQWSPDWYAAGQTDDTMGYFVSTWGFGDSILLQAAGGEGGATYGRWACTEGPTPYFWGGTWICVSPSTDNADMIASFIDYFTINEDSMMQYALYKSGGEYVNNMNVMQEIVDCGYNSNSNLGGQDQFAVVHENAKNINMMGLITPYDAAIKTAFLDAVNNYCDGYVSNAEECIEVFKDYVSVYATDVIVE